MDDVVWESLCEQLWRGSLLAKDVKVEGCSSNPLFGPWSQCRASQTNIERHVTMLDVALPSAFCRLAQPGKLLYASQFTSHFLEYYADIRLSLLRRSAAPFFPRVISGEP